ncbi:MAG: RecQ family ATP-dependent DNA helicase, partial [Clostridia bacterium]|nr:RecQ family ATP-dependent DNA helicase [Clostridia bacterium]
MTDSIVFIDAEISADGDKILDIGAVKTNGSIFHSKNIGEFSDFISGADFICGHNIFQHDLVYLKKSNIKEIKSHPIDTLYLSPLLFPAKPYHKLLKDDKLLTDALNNPVNDCMKAIALFYDEVNAFNALEHELKEIYYLLLSGKEEFSGFFEFVDFKLNVEDTETLIKKTFEGEICKNADIRALILKFPMELAYVLSLIKCEDYHSVTPPWLIKNFPEIENIIAMLRYRSCTEGCKYCNDTLNIKKELKHFFGYDDFRTYNGEPLQEEASQAAVDGKSLLAIFPTGGGKSLTFQLPALMAGKATHGLTVVISPLQSLMKDQVDNLVKKGILDAVAINGLLDPIERANAIERVADGSASIMYISPESLRSRTIEKILLTRNVVRFVIDEAHCFSAWGQDFRVDYLYIGDYIRNLQKNKTNRKAIPISCFTATAKQKVVTDICDYFKSKLDIDLEIFASYSARDNLKYSVIYKESEEEKYVALRDLISQKNCSTIVYVSRTRSTVELASKLTNDGFPARPFSGKLDVEEKIKNQEAFISNEVQVIVATSAFGMGVDKRDVGLVVHYDISSSLEDYVQESGRAGRDPKTEADCYVLYSDTDLDKHFILLNQSKLSISEIQQVWRAIKEMTKVRKRGCLSPLEIARQAGWSESIHDVETRVKTAIMALERAGYLKRGYNVPHIYATSIMVKNMEEASERIEKSHLLSENQRTSAKRIIKSLISSRSIARAGNDDAESRVDYLADTLGMNKNEVIDIVNVMRQDGILADTLDMSAYILSNETENRSKLILDRFLKLEDFLLQHLDDDKCEINLKELNEEAQKNKIGWSSVMLIRTLLYYHVLQNNIRKEELWNSALVYIYPLNDVVQIRKKYFRRAELCGFIIKKLFEKANVITASQDDEKLVLFSLVELYNEYVQTPKIDADDGSVALADVKDALLYLSKIGALKIEGGFLVSYNGIEIKRLQLDNRIQYKNEDYKFLNEFYKQKIQQIHIVGEYANLMVKDYDAALRFVADYFQMDYRLFISKYFRGERSKELNRNITSEKYNQLFGELSDKQAEIINDADSKYIIVASGPGSAKTRVLVHKLAALLRLEEV